MTLIREIVTDAKTGETTERWIDIPQAYFDAQAALIAAEKQADTNRQTIEQQADSAMADLSAFLALQSPTNAQTLAAVRLLCRIQRKMIRLAVRKFDGTD
jgi:cytochrome c553